MEKYGTAGQAQDKNGAEKMRFACPITKECIRNYVHNIST